MEIRNASTTSSKSSQLQNIDTVRWGLGNVDRTLEYGLKNFPKIFRTLDIYNPDMYQQFSSDLKILELK